MKKIIASNIISDYPEAKSIINDLNTNQDTYSLSSDSTIYFGFPKFVGYEEDSVEPDLLILSKKHGIIVIRFTKDFLSDKKIEEIADEIYGLLFSKLNESKKLRASRKSIKIQLETYVFNKNTKSSSEFSINSIEEIIEKLESQKLTTEIDEIIFSEARSIIEGTKALASFNNRKIGDEDTSSLAFIISKLENEIKTFDLNQLQSAITIIDGPQRIRGLAGSGKTVVLAMKAAQIHINEPDKVILFTFSTKSLYQQIKDLITKFFRHYKKVDPNWDNIQIKHAWGGVSIDGTYYSTCIENGIAPINFSVANKLSNDPFDYVCKKAIENSNLKMKYDYVLIDEAQDLPINFFRFIYKISKFNKTLKKEKNIIWGYDDFQNLFNVKTKTPKMIFGQNKDNEDLVDLDRSSNSILPNDIVLYKCYRNPRSILLVAHSLGFGLYNNENNLPVQILEDQGHWEDFGYKVLSGPIIDYSKVIVERPIENSPLSIQKYIDDKDLIEYYEAPDYKEEIKWICKKVEDSIHKDYLNREDILIISLDDKNSKNYFEAITEELIKKDIYVNNILLNPYTSTDFVKKDCVTLSTVYRAKGNEAPMVFVIGIDAMYKLRKTRKGRNRIFTAFTRTKCSLKVSGVSSEAKYFFDEIDKTLIDYPMLNFIQPSKEEVERLQRDLNDKSKKLKIIRKEYQEKLKEEGFSPEEIDEELKELSRI